MSDPYQPILDTLSRAKRVLVTTHVRPDGDALGSAAALVLGLRQRQIDAEVLLLSHLPRKYAFIFKDYQITHHDAESGWPTTVSESRGASARGLGLRAALDRNRPGAPLDSD